MKFPTRFKKTKLKAVQEGVPLKVVITRALQREVDGPAPMASRKSVEWKIPVAPHGLNDKKLSWDQIKQLMDDEMDSHLLHKLKGGQDDAQP